MTPKTEPMGRFYLLIGELNPTEGTPMVGENNIVRLAPQRRAK
jgi:hypothetical protein